MAPEAGELADSANGLRAVRWGKSEVAVQPRAHVVAVEHLDVLAVPEHELLFQSGGDCGLAGAAQARHPERDTLLVQRFKPLRSGQVARLRAARGRRGALDDVRGRRRQSFLTVRGHVELAVTRQAAARQDEHDGTRQQPAQREELVTLHGQRRRSVVIEMVRPTHG
eukprot:CAMPEP_0184238994 /NCGR_PEP_ID=MMETSP0976-20121227/27154_1 /TAXON_ID=483370 /ORGANISM="non described non described, Strain CCMP2097" /LENGTH=166 /DNA_ID=CAMNT_0026544191 /DNA_START=280 /DNA_END=776 /DNA_ORIENTATION=-